jgi:hypothetical protein
VAVPQTSQERLSKIESIQDNDNPMDGSQRYDESFHRKLHPAILDTAPQRNLAARPAMRYP